MGIAATGVRGRIAGRVRELSLLGDAVRRTSKGSPCAVLVHGEAGVGKTTLVHEVCRAAASAGFHVLWGRCLRFGATSSPYLCLVGALEGWLTHATAEEREGLLGSTPDLEHYLPSLGGRATTRGTDALSVFDLALSWLSRQRPTVLVVEDLQWGDVSSLDVLAYLTVALRSKPLSVVMTLRDDDVPEGHPLHLWLEDLRRLPTVVDLPLPRLSPEETEDLVAGVLGRHPGPELVEEVFARSQGNAYLAELLVRDLPPDATSLAMPMPEALRSVLTSRWHALSRQGRLVTRLVAVAGRPVPSTILEAAGEEEVGSARAVDAAVHEAVRTGVLAHVEPGRVWFRHPLLAEVLLDDALPDELAVLHERYVQILNDSGQQDLRTCADLALHLEGTGRKAEAMAQHLRAAKLAAAEDAFPEQADLYRRAANLSTSASMWVDAAYASFRAGEHFAGARCAAKARELADPIRDPTETLRALLAWLDLERVDGRPHTTEAAEILRGALDRWDSISDGPLRARLLVKVAESELWRGNVAAGRRFADRAVAVARGGGAGAVVSEALSVRSLARLADPDGAERDAEESHRVALSCDEPEPVLFAAVARGSVREERGDLSGSADAYVEACELLRHRNVPGIMQPLSAWAAEPLVVLGRLPEARGLVRRSLSIRPRGSGALLARMLALHLAVREGRTDDADRHHRRMYELTGAPEALVGWPFAAVLAEYELETGRPQGAVRVVDRALEAYGRADPKYRVVLIMWGVRAAAELAVAARDRRDRAGESTALATSERYLAAQTLILEEVAKHLHDPLLRARLAVVEAEAQRCADGSAQQRCWEVAVARLDEVALVYDAVLARIRLVECLLGSGEGSPAAAMLRRANRTANQIGALAIAQECAALARSARIPLAEPDSKSVSSDLLTPREREVLAHLVAGRTYAEIATALVISQKTVSVHISHLLRKTGTTNRASLAAWARRNGIPAPSGSDLLGEHLDRA